MLGVVAVANGQRDVPVDHRTECLGMNDLGAEISQFHSLVVCEALDNARFRHLPGIGTHHTIDVSPDRQFAGIGQSGENRRGEITAVASQRGLQSLLVGGDETRKYGNSREVFRQLVAKSSRRSVPEHGWAQFRVPHDDDASGVDPGAAARRVLLCQ